MKNSARLTKSGQFAAVYNEGGTQADRLLVLKAARNQLGYSRFGISINKRVGSAVVRNRVKRVLREILRTKRLTPGWDYIFIARNPAAESNYQEMVKSVNNLIARFGVSEAK